MNANKKGVIHQALDNYECAVAMHGSREPIAYKFCLTNEMPYSAFLDTPKPTVIYTANRMTYSGEINEAWVFATGSVLGDAIYKDPLYREEQRVSLEFYEITLFMETIIECYMADDEAIVFESIMRTSVSSTGGFVHYKDVVMDYPTEIVIANLLAINPKRSNVQIKTYAGFLACVSTGKDIINVDNWGINAWHRMDRSTVYYFVFLSAWLAGVRSIKFWNHYPLTSQVILDAISKAATPKEFMLLGALALGLNAEDIERKYLQR